MRPLLSSALAAQSTARQRVYTALLGEPDRGWTVAAMAQLLPDVAVHEVRTTLHLLLGDRLMDIETGTRQRSLTLRLTSDGQQTLAETLRSWANPESGQPVSAALGGRNAP